MEYTRLQKNYDMSLEVILQNVRDNLIKATKKRLIEMFHLELY